MTKKEFLKIVEDLKNINEMYSYVIDDILGIYPADEDFKNNYKDMLNYLNNVLKHGCCCGMVTSLVYYSQTEEFYNKYKFDIQEILIEIIAQESDFLKNHEMYDDNDPLFIDQHNQNWMAWLGYEHVCNELLDRIEGVS